MFKLPAINKEVILQEKSDKKQYNSKILKFAHICLVIIEQDKFGFSYLLTEKKFIFIFFLFFSFSFFIFHIFFIYLFILLPPKKNGEKKQAVTVNLIICKTWFEDICCIFRPGFGWCMLQMLVEIWFFAFFTCMYSQFLRFVTARRSCTGLVTVDPTKV